jgi:hypothetical protein
MTDVEKAQVRVTLPSYVITQLDQAYKDRRLNTRSELITEYCKDGLAKEEIIILPVRIANAKDVIYSKIDTLLSVNNVVVTGSGRHKFNIACGFGAVFGTASACETAKNTYNVALFELLEDLKSIDLEEYRLTILEIVKYRVFMKGYKKYCSILSGQSTL